MHDIASMALMQTMRAPHSLGRSDPFINPTLMTKYHMNDSMLPQRGENKDQIFGPPRALFDIPSSQVLQRRSLEDLAHVAVQLDGQRFVEHMDVQTSNLNVEDDDDFSDHDSHYSEDEIDPIYFQGYPQATAKRDITQQLLDFSEMVNGDIQKFFSRRKGEEDSCDIYQDKWTSGKSGRELYYADLLRVAHGDTGDDNKKGSHRDSLPNSPVQVDNRDTFSGKMDQKIGLGPLSELFDYGLRHYLLDKNHRSGIKVSKKSKNDFRKYEESVSMHHRHFPLSFWKEPGTAGDSRCSVPRDPALGINHQQSHPAPDFSDLLQSWTGNDATNAPVGSSVSAHMEH